MTEHPSPLDNPQQINHALEVTPEDERNADPALIEAVRRDTLDALRKESYTIEHVYSGQHGGPAVDVITSLTAAAKVTSQSKAKTTASVPRSQPRKRR